MSDVTRETTNYRLTGKIPVQDIEGQQTVFEYTRWFALIHPVIYKTVVQTLICLFGCFYIYLSKRVDMNINRREFLTGSGIIVTALAGCSEITDSEQPAHTVSVYLGNRTETHDVTVTVENADGSSLFDEQYRLSSENESQEDATFPESTNPETVRVTVNETHVERDWPGVESEELPCQGENWVGIELYIQGSEDGSPDVRLEANCQHVTMGK